MGSIYVICSRQCPNGDGIYTLLYALYKYSTSITNQPTWELILIWLSPRSDLLRGPGLGDGWGERARHGRLVTARRWSDSAAPLAGPGFHHAGYAPATCWAGLFGRLRPGGKLRPLEINPLITVRVGNCDRNYDHTSLVVHMTLIAQL